MTILGTPLTSSATKVLFLGSGELGKEVMIEMQRLGVEVIAVDRLEDFQPDHVVFPGAQGAPGNGDRGGGAVQGPGLAEIR